MYKNTRLFQCYRDEYDNVAFIYASDDMSWGKDDLSSVKDIHCVLAEVVTAQKYQRSYFDFNSTQSIFYHTITAGCITKIRSNMQISARTNPSNTGGPSLITNASQDSSEYKKYPMFQELLKI